MSTAVTFIAGATAALSAVAALFFVRFWARSRDRLFLAFGAAFVVFAANRVALTAVAAENDVWIYACRLLAFVLIVGAIVDKNRPR
jgi:hypothetical protein